MDTRSRWMLHLQNFLGRLAIFFVAPFYFTLARVIQEGLREQRAYAAQIIQKLAQMEEIYFAAHRERYRGFNKPALRAKKHGFALSEENPHRY